MATKQITTVIFIIVLITACTKKPPERMVDIGGYNLHIYDTGFGKPTVIFEYALSSTGGVIRFADIQKEIATFTRAISYDRAGIGKSDESPLPRSYENMVKELKLMLEEEKIDPPYILVGYSLGGHLVRLFTDTYPEDVVGLVLVDGSHEDFFDRIKANRTEEEWGEIDSTINNLISQNSEIARKEWDAYIMGCELMKTVEIPANIPVQVITAAKYGWTFEAMGLSPEDILLWLELQSDWIKNKPNAKQTITEKSSHGILGDEPQLVISAIKEVLDEVKKVE
jgi:hypothetical protein